MAGSVRPKEIVIVGRRGDVPTENVVACLEQEYDGEVMITSGWVDCPGHVPPVQLGARIAGGEILAIVDDDVAVTNEWLGRLVRNFEKPVVGVVGGRMIIPGFKHFRLKGRPGRISWYGRYWGNLGIVDASGSFEVDAVVECNWAWRRDVLASLVFDPVLNFDDGYMYGFDLCLQAKKLGYRVIYEPQAVVYHHVAPRAAELDREDDKRRIYAHCRNGTYATLKNVNGLRRLAFLAWCFLIGGYRSWGLGAALVDLVMHCFRWRHVGLREAWRGKLAGVYLWSQYRRSAPWAGASMRDQTRRAHRGG
jgi:GT2 family glycosyltransferase